MNTATPTAHILKSLRAWSKRRRDDWKGDCRNETWQVRRVLDDFDTALKEIAAGKVWNDGNTTMVQTIAETYARDPFFYSGTFCANCRAHFPVGDGGEFVWAGTTEKVGT